MKQLYKLNKLIMKKIFMIVAAVAGLFATAACQKEIENPMNGREVSVSLTVEVPANLDTKAIAQAEEADIVYYEVWNADWSKQLYPVDNSALASAVVDQKKAVVELVLVADQTYNFIFWAQDKDHGAYDVNELKNVKIKYAAMAEGNQDKFDAFYAVKQLTVTGPINETIYLYRPFAQLNFGASRMNSSLGDITIGATSVTVDGLATEFNTIDGVGTKEAASPVTFKSAGLASDTEELVTNSSSYTWITMDYMCMMDNKSTVDVTANFEVKDIGKVHHHLTSVPVQRNYRTNIVGDIFTTDAKLEIIIDPAFKKPDHIVGIGTPIDNKVSLQASIDKASDGEVLVLADGEYEGTFLIENKSLTLVAENPGQAVIKGKVGVAYKDVTFNGIAFEVSSATAAATSNSLVNKAGSYIIPIYCANVVVENCTFSGMTDDDGAIYYYANDSGATNENLEKLTVRDSKFVGERAIRSRANVEVTGCEFEGLLNPCLQVLGFGDGSLNGKVIFTDNTSYNVVNGVTIKTGNFVIANVDFNVGGNVNCNTIAYDTKKVSNMHQDTFTYSGEVTTIVVEP